MVTYINIESALSVILVKNVSNANKSLQYMQHINYIHGYSRNYYWATYLCKLYGWSSTLLHAEELEYDCVINTMAF